MIIVTEFNDRGNIIYQEDLVLFFPRHQKCDCHYGQLESIYDDSDVIVVDADSINVEVISTEIDENGVETVTSKASLKNLNYNSFLKEIPEGFILGIGVWSPAGWKVTI